MAARGVQTAGEVVPLADRMRYLHLFRLVAAATVALSALLSPAGWVGGKAFALGAVVYALGSIAGLWLWSRTRRRNLPLFGAFLLLDGVFLAVSVYANGALTSPIRYAILLHLVTVALIASYRTGLKLAIWHSLLLMVFTEAQRVGLLERTTSAVVGDGTIAFVVAIWLVTLVVSGASAVNERELRRRRADLESLARLSTTLEQTDDPRAVAESSTAIIAASFDLLRLALVDAREGVLATLARHGNVASATRIVPLEESLLASRALDERTTLLVADPGEVDPWFAELLGPARNAIVLPMMADDRPLGLLVAELDRPVRGGRVESRVVGTLERFSSHVAMALHNAWLHESLTRHATTDGLTGLANRRTFDTRLVTELARCERSGEPLALVIADVDHFKQFNDRHGHLVGDEILREVATLLAAGCRPFDLAARFGGEEFVVVLPGAATEEARAIAERLRATIEHADLDTPVTISAGVAFTPDGCTVPELLLADADRALYRAKASGRNRVCVAGDEVHQPAEPA